MRIWSAKLIWGQVCFAPKVNYSNFLLAKYFFFYMYKILYFKGIKGTLNFNSKKEDK